MKRLFGFLFIVIIGIFINISFSYDTDYYWQDIFQNHGSVMLIINPDTGEIVSANSAAENFYGYEIDDLKSMNINEINVLADDNVKGEMDKAITQNRNYFEFDHKISDGSIRHVEVYSYPTETIDGQNLLFSIIHDVTEKMQLEKEIYRNRMITMVLLIIILITLIALIINIEISKTTLKKEKNLFKTILHSIGDGVISVSSNNSINFINKEAESLIGLSNEEVSGKNLSDIFKIIDSSENIILDLISDSKKIVSDERFLITKSGSKVPIDYNLSNTISEIGIIDGFVIAFRDYTYKKEKQDEIIYLSYHDQLTGLNNRRFFEEKIIELDTEENLPLTIAMIDVNGLKLTNDAFGHSVGDKLLKKVAEILIENCPYKELISRVGGDEFVIILPKTTLTESKKIVRKIYNSFKGETIDNIIISVSIGCSTKTTKEEKISDIFSKAEDYMYKKKLTESQSMRNRTVKGILKKLSEKSPREKIHSEKVSIIAKKIGRFMRLDDMTLDEIETVGLLHDIGKISINQDILELPRKLTQEEYEEVKRHPECGYYILKSVDNYSYMADYILSHHERFDGKGYPTGKKGKDIPLISRIISVADAYESMSSNRPYRKALSKEKIIKEFKANSSTQFDPDIVKVLLENIFEF